MNSRKLPHLRKKAEIIVARETVGAETNIEAESAQLLERERRMTDPGMGRNRCKRIQRTDASLHRNHLDKPPEAHPLLWHFRDQLRHRFEIRDRRCSKTRRFSDPVENACEIILLAHFRLLQ